MGPSHAGTFLARYDDPTPPTVTSWLADPMPEAAGILEAILADIP